jgi:hypothetical protein
MAEWPAPFGIESLALQLPEKRFTPVTASRDPVATFRVYVFCLIPAPTPAALRVGQPAQRLGSDLRGGRRRGVAIQQQGARDKTPF